MPIFTVMQVRGGSPSVRVDRPNVPAPPSTPRNRAERRQERAGRLAAQDAAKQAKDLANRQRWGRTPGLAFNASILGSMVMVLLAASTPTFAVWGLLFVAYLPVSFLFWLARFQWRHDGPAPTGWRTSRMWFAVPFVAGCLMLGLLHLDAPFKVRFAASRSTFAASAADIRETKRSEWVPVSGESIAGFPISEGHRFGRQVWFRYSGQSGFLDFHTRFIAYLPDGPDGDDFADRGLEVSDYISSTVVTLGDGWYYIHDQAELTRRRVHPSSAGVLVR